jgi:hypothetical protein
MNHECKTLLEKLSAKGWDVRLSAHPRAFPEDVKSRYYWIPAIVQEFFEGTEAVVAPDQKSWFLTSAQLYGVSGWAFSWNQWELDSLEAAGNDLRWQEEIRRFWDRHFPVFMSVKSGYAYFAIRQEDLAIVWGEEPEYEETTHLADSFATMLAIIESGDPRLSFLI